MLSLSHLLDHTKTAGGLIINSIGVFGLFIGLRSMIELAFTRYVILAWIVLVRSCDTRSYGVRPTPLQGAVSIR